MTDDERASTSRILCAVGMDGIEAGSSPTAGERERHEARYRQMIADFVAEFAPEDRQRMVEFQAGMMRIMGTIYADAQQQAIAMALAMAQSKDMPPLPPHYSGWKITS